MSRQLSDEVIAGRAAISVNDPGTCVPEGWTRVLLTDIARLESGHTPSRKHPEWWGGDIPWVSLPDAREHHGGVIHDTTQKTNELGLANSAARLLPKDTVCLSRTASVGYVFRLGRPMATSQDFVNWVCSDALDPRFLQQALLAEGKHLLNFGMGTTHTTIYFPAVLAFHINLAPLPEQRRMVEKVDGLLEQVKRARGRLDRVPLILKRFRQAVLAAACSGELTREWRELRGGAPEAGAAYLRSVLRRRPARFDEDQAARASGRRNRYKEPVVAEEGDGLPDTPESWAWTSLDALTIKIVDGVHHTPTYVKSGVPFVTVRNLTAGPNLDLRKLNYVTEADHREFIERANPARGDLLISKDGTLGVVRAVRTDEVFSIFVSVAVLKPVTTEMTDYLELMLSAPQIQERMMPTGSGLLHLHLRDLRTVPVPVPPLEEQTEIVRQVAKLFALADTIERRLQAATTRADKLPQAILSKAFSGELVPTEAELARAEGRTYETAEELLKRVGASATTAGSGAKARRRGARRTG